MHLYGRIASEVSVKLKENGKSICVTVQGVTVGVCIAFFFMVLFPILLHLGSLLL